MNKLIKYEETDNYIILVDKDNPGGYVEVRWKNKNCPIKEILDPKNIERAMEEYIKCQIEE